MCQTSPLKMEMAQTQQAEELEPHTFLAFVPPKGDVCLINNLPPELLGHIFELGSADDGIEDIPPKDDRKMANAKDIHDHDAEVKEDENEEGDKEEFGDKDESSQVSLPFRFVVPQVCRHWRNIAMSTPALWTTIEVTSATRPPYEAVSMLLERSKSLPIDLYLYCAFYKVKDDMEPLSDADLRFLFAMLIPHIHRWQTIVVSLRVCQLMYTFLCAVSDPAIPAAPRLTAVELYDYEDIAHFDNSPYPSISKHLTLFGGSAPLLTTIVLWGVHVDWDQPWISSASNLADLELAFHSEDVRPSWAQISTILRSPSALQKLTLRKSGPSGDPAGWLAVGCPTNPSAPIQLPHVTDFGVIFHSQAHAIGLLRKFCLPALKSLVLGFYDDDYTDLVHELAGPATSLSLAQEPRSLLSGLESLKIAGLPCRTECVETLYSELRNLTSLNISLVFLDQLFLDILSTPCTLPERGDIWLPRLVTLRVSGAFVSTLRDLVSTRRELGVPLSSLYVEKRCYVLDEDAEWFKENLETFELFDGSEDADYDELDEEYDGDDVDMDEEYDGDDIDMDEEVDDDDIDDWSDT
ncbi:hypothetical protein L210DRAFT_3568080 [Boletus edulis BED1]|uniref:F-box domain-containing protein n=1 Tax=Boletus edulis BED1 TaxID=1328754 RepID=A0AAD4BEB3_BOLED|nr:hypothetical protein L210DRAFT_3568080 [Boletus edulis BED1]